MIGYRELLYKNQLDLLKLEERKSESTFTHTIPIYQNPDTERPSADPYRIVQDYRLSSLYRKTILVNFDKLPEGLRGFTDTETRMDIDEDDYKIYDVMAHEATHMLFRDRPEYWVRAYSPRGIRSFEEFKRRFSQFNFIIMGRS